MNVDQIDPINVTVSEARRISGLSNSEFYRRMADGKISAVKVGRSTLVNLASLRAHLDSLPAATFRGRHEYEGKVVS